MRVQGWYAAESLLHSNKAYGLSGLGSNAGLSLRVLRVSGAPPLHMPGQFHTSAGACSAQRAHACAHVGVLRPAQVPQAMLKEGKQAFLSLSSAPLYLCRAQHPPRAHTLAPAGWCSRACARTEGTSSPRAPAGISPQAVRGLQVLKPGGRPFNATPQMPACTCDSHDNGGQPQICGPERWGHRDLPTRARTHACDRRGVVNGVLHMHRSARGPKIVGHTKEAMMLTKKHVRACAFLLLFCGTHAQKRS